MPFYKVTTKGSEKTRVVEADNPAAATRHLAQGMFTLSKPLSTSDLMVHVRDGITVEKAGDEPAATDTAATE